MARFHGAIGYAEAAVETPSGSGIFVESIKEFEYSGDITRTTRNLNEIEQVNPGITAGHTVSIVADPYANEHFFAIRYASWSGALWTVTNVEVQSPRLLLRLGGVYNGPTAAETP